MDRSRTYFNRSSLMVALTGVEVMATATCRRQTSHRPCQYQQRGVQVVMVAAPLCDMLRDRNG
jgi:hypothetical protein